MIRNVAREIAMHLSYELSFTDLSAGELLDQRLSSTHFGAIAPEYEVYGEVPGPSQRAYIRKLVSGIAAHGYELDQYIEKYAKGWRFERIPLVAGAINEAVEIAKKYESPEVVRFINGILGSFVREEAADSAAPADSPSPAATDGE